jgi:flagellin
MSLDLINNLNSLTANQNLSNTQSALSKTMEQLSTGLQINSAADGAANYAIGQDMMGTINATNQAINNANQGVSMLQTAQGGLSNISNILQQMNSLAMQSANGTLSAADRTDLNSQFQTLNATLGSIIANTSFNGTALLSAASSVNIQTGQAATINVSLTAISTTSTADTLSTTAAATSALAHLAADIGTISTATANLGAAQNELSFTVANLQTSLTNVTTARSAIMDTNFGQAAAQLSQQQTLASAGISVLAQANQSGQGVLQLLR